MRSNATSRDTREILDAATRREFLAMLGAAADLAELEQNAPWAGLPAVQTGAVETVPFRLNYGSVLAANACLDRVEALFQEMATPRPGSAPGASHRLMQRMPMTRH